MADVFSSVTQGFLNVLNNTLLICIVQGVTIAITSVLDIRTRDAALFPNGSLSSPRVSRVVSAAR